MALQQKSLDTSTVEVEQKKPCHLCKTLKTAEAERAFSILDYFAKKSEAISVKTLLLHSYLIANIISKMYSDLVRTGWLLLVTLLILKNFRIAEQNLGESRLRDF